MWQKTCGCRSANQQVSLYRITKSRRCSRDEERAMKGSTQRSHLWLALVTGIAARVYSTARVDRSWERSWTDEVHAGSSRSVWADASRF